MNQIRKNTGRPLALLLTLCITFLFLAVVTPSEKIDSANITVNSKNSRMPGVQTTAQGTGRAHLITTLSDNEIISEIEINLFTDGHFRDFRGFNFRFNKLLLPIISFCVMVLCFGYVIHRNEQNKSILTILLGGHAPPERPSIKHA